MTNSRDFEHVSGAAMPVAAPKPPGSLREAAQTAVYQLYVSVGAFEIRGMWMLADDARNAAKMLEECLKADPNGESTH